MFETAIALQGGRKLEYAENGAKAGYPVFLIHGVPGSRFHPFAYLATRDSSDIRVIVPERPGYGLSNAMRDRTLFDHITDVRFLAVSLGIEQFSVVGISGGVHTRFVLVYSGSQSWLASRPTIHN